MFVLQRSRAGSKTSDERHGRVERGEGLGVAGELLASPRRSAARARRPPRRAEPVGEAASSAMRIRSMAARASSGWVSHVRARRSHSLGPREPNSWTKASKPSRNARAPSEVSAASRSRRPSTPGVEAAVSSSEAGQPGEVPHAPTTARPSRPPMPPMRRTARVGSPRPAVMAPSAPGPSDAPSDAQTWSRTSAAGRAGATRARARSAATVQRRQVGPLVPQAVGEDLLLVELGERLGAHHPGHRLAELGGVPLALVPRLLLVGRDLGVGRRSRRGRWPPASRRACARPSGGPGRAGCRSSRRTARSTPGRSGVSYSS